MSWVMLFGDWSQGYFIDLDEILLQRTLVSLNQKEP